MVIPDWVGAQHASRGGEWGGAAVVTRVPHMLYSMCC